MRQLMGQQGLELIGRKFGHQGCRKQDHGLERADHQGRVHERRPQ